MYKYLPILFFASVLAGCENKSADDLLIEAKKFDSTQNYSAAIQLYDKILTLDINRSDIFLRRAIDKGLTKDSQGEIQDLKEVLKSDPEDVAALFQFGIANQHLRHYGESIESFSKAIRIKEAEKKEANQVNLEESNSTGDILLARIYFERGMEFYKVDSIQDAVTDFSFTINNGYSLTESYFYRGCAFLKQRKISNACVDLRASERSGMIEAKDSIAKYCMDK